MPTENPQPLRFKFLLICLTISPKLRRLKMILNKKKKQLETCECLVCSFIIYLQVRYTLICIPVKLQISKYVRTAVLWRETYKEMRSKRNYKNATATKQDFSSQYKSQAAKHEFINAATISAVWYSGFRIIFDICKIKSTLVMDILISVKNTPNIRRAETDAKSC